MKYHGVQKSAVVIRTLQDASALVAFVATVRGDGRGRKGSPQTFYCRMITSIHVFISHCFPAPIPHFSKREDQPVDTETNGSQIFRT